MQNGSVIRAERQRGPDGWEFRWREAGADGKRKRRRMILGSIEQLADETAARQAIATLRLDLNHSDACWSDAGRRPAPALCHPDQSFHHPPSEPSCERGRIESD